jgi:hypothetical protein
LLLNSAHLYQLFGRPINSFEVDRHPSDALLSFDQQINETA